MYFISRNNMIYSYIAHTSLRRCYAATLLGVGAFFIIGSYGVYYPLCAHVALLQSECIALHIKCDEIVQFDKSGQELGIFVESAKKNIADHAVMSDKRGEECYKRMLYVLDAVAQSNLILNAYSACNEKDKEWYVKDSAHFDVSGSLQKIMTFLETMKKSRRMITLSHVIITRGTNDIFQMGCDVGLITIKS